MHMCVHRAGGGRTESETEREAEEIETRASTHIWQMESQENNIIYTRMSLLDVLYVLGQYWLQHEAEWGSGEEGGDGKGAGEEEGGEEDDIVLQEYHSEDEKRLEPE